MIPMRTRLSASGTAITTTAVAISTRIRFVPSCQFVHPATAPTAAPLQSLNPARFNLIGLQTV